MPQTYSVITCGVCGKDKPLAEMWDKFFSLTHGWGTCKECREVQEQEALMDLVVG